MSNERDFTGGRRRNLAEVRVKLPVAQKAVELTARKTDCTDTLAKIR